MRIILLGPPGCGKGTQAEIISKRFNIPQISTGNILREEVNNKSELGMKVAATMAKGDLVDDDTIISIIVKTLKSPECANGFILDGVPRSVPQADSLREHGIAVDHILEFKCSDEAIIERITNRRVHLASGRVYNTLFNPPKEENKDDVTGEELVQRADDNEETVRSRLDAYQKTTSPLIKYYQDLAKQDGGVAYHEIDAQADAGEITDKLLGLLGGET